MRFSVGREERKQPPWRMDSQPANRPEKFPFKPRIRVRQSENPRILIASRQFSFSSLLSVLAIGIGKSHSLFAAAVCTLGRRRRRRRCHTILFLFFAFIFFALSPLLFLAGWLAAVLRRQPADRDDTHQINKYPLKS